MRRRDFIAASAALALLVSRPVEAAKKTVAKPATKAPTKPAAKAAAKPAGRQRPAVAESAEHSGEKNEAREAIALPDEPAAKWRTYDVRSSVVLSRVAGKARVWIPLAQYKDTPWERSLDHSWQGNFDQAGIYRDPVADMEVFYADWNDAANAELQIVSRIATQDRHFDITRRGVAAERTEVLRRCLQATQLVPNDGAVRRTAESVIGRLKDPVAQGKAIYDWVVDRSAYDSNARSSRRGGTHIGTMLESGNLSGHSNEIALLFVGLCRSIGIPARPVFGLRIDRSRLFTSLGASGDLASAQHCRAEFYAPGYGWIPVDPADVCRAIREEQLARGGSQLSVLKKLLFGFWEMNWIGFNAAQDVILTGSSGKSLAFLTQPLVESAEGRFDAHDGRLAYAVSASRVDS